MRIPTNKISDITKFYFNELEGVYSTEELRSILYLLYEHFLGLTKIQVVTESDRRVHESDLILLYKGMEAVKNLVPIQYVIKKSHFFDLDFFVDERVLIPRQETEELVNWIIQDYKHTKGTIKGLDICTGSGCIAISLQKNFLNLEIKAVDISKEALQVAQLNAKNLESNVLFFEGDVLQKETWNFFDECDFIVANPPYVANSEKDLMHRNVLDHEPHLALFVENEDPLLFYREILVLGKEKIKANGFIYFEINERFGNEVAELAKVIGYQNVKVRKDMNGKDRMLKVFA